jgi:hypothetical protein
MLTSRITTAAKEIHMSRVSAGSCAWTAVAPAPWDEPARGEVEVVAGQEVPEHLDQGDAGQEHGKMGLHLGGHAGRARLHPDATVQVVRDHRDHGDHDERYERPADEEGQEGQLEDEEADVLVELGVLHPEGHAVEEQQVVLPLSDGPRGRHQRQHQRHDGAHQHGVGGQGVLVAAHQLVLGTEGELAGGEAVDDGQVDPQQHEEDRGEPQEETHFHRQEPVPHVAQVHRPEPQEVRVEGGHGAQGRQQDDQDDHRHDQPDAPPPTDATRRPGHVLRRSHGRAA